MLGRGRGGLLGGRDEERLGGGYPGRRLSPGYEGAGSDYNEGRLIGRGHRRGGIAGLIGTGIGLYQETRRKKSDSQLSTANEGSTSFDNDAPRRASFESPGHHPDEKSSIKDGPPAYDDLDWELDEVAQDERDEDRENGEPPSYSESQSSKSVAEQINSIAQGRGPPVASRLAAPVLLPQRRPGNRVRGFVRAYSPALHPCGIDQTMWMDFLEVFDVAVKANPFFYVANIAVEGLSAIPIPSAIALSAAAHISVEAAKRVQESRQQNHFLDDVNNKIFKPRGLYCMIMSFDSHQRSTGEVQNISQAIDHSTSQAESSRPMQGLNNMRRYDHQTRGDVEIPESAPLIFPDLGQDEEAIIKQSVWKEKMALAGDYMDRRAQAKFNYANPNSKLSVGPEPTFASRYSDPNHPAVNNGLIGLVTGGAIAPRDRRRARREARRERWGRPPGGIRERRGQRRQRREDQGRQGLVGMGLGTVRRNVREGTLYVIVVNLPSEGEVAQVLGNERLMGRDIKR